MRKSSMDVGSYNRVSRAADAIRARELRAELSRVYQQHVSDGGEGPKPVGTIAFIQVFLNALECETHAHVVAAFGPGQIVIKLRSRVIEVV